MLTYADAQEGFGILTCASVAPIITVLASGMLTYAHVCSRMFTYADMLTALDEVR